MVKHFECGYDKCQHTKVSAPRHYTVESWDKYVRTGASQYLVPFNIRSAWVGQKFMIAWEGGETLVQKTV